MVKNVNKFLKLFRYDIKEPPLEWDANAHSKNSEHSSQFMQKNMEAFYFLYDDENVARAVAEVACEKLQRSGYWLTRTQTLEELSIIDFSHCKCIHEMLDVLESLRINVCTQEMKFNGLNNRNFQELINHNYSTRIVPTFPNLIETGYLGQLLTDFDNGRIFKQKIIEAHLKIDGYRWCENVNPYALTYCLFDSAKLSIPTKQCVH